jgi:peptidoglycan hydrolase-like protein with peptidoglycan-binding domain
MLRYHGFPLLACLVLAACGTTPEERGLSGAGIGAASGAIIGAVTGLSVVEGAVLGAVAGGLTGAVTREDQINLGKPAWKQGTASEPQPAAQSSAARTATATPTPSRSANAQVVKDIQSGLARLGYDPGPVDGIAGQRTRSAIRAYQQDHGLLVDGQPTQELAEHIRERSGVTGQPGAKTANYNL